MELSGKCVVVVGLGQSGVAAARLCRARGARVVATDTAPLGSLSAAARGLEVELLAGSHEGVPFSTADLVVVSPGVPALPELARAETQGVEVIGELELAARFISAPVVAVGGTNGKSTTTMLVGCMLEAAFDRVFVGGNLGTPLAAAVGSSWDCVVVEVSSFQLERIPRFRPRVSVLLNITDDHLDRYPDAVGYARAKGNAFVNQVAEDVAVIPHGDPACLAQALRGAGRRVTFGPGGAFSVEDHAIVERPSGERYPLVETEIRGAHNELNAAAAAAAARAVGAAPDAVRAGLARFRPLAHRMVLVASNRGVRYYDDSKGTNVGAAVTALRGLPEARAVLIAGGRDKLGAYDDLVAALLEKGRAAVLIGEAADRIEAAIAGRVPVVRAVDMGEAVARAAELARPGDAVLLSPACSSFDMYRSYAERGDRFAAAVRSLAATPPAADGGEP
ncbi:MAG: UDP-N-acetylmuramoyl-L-alanine--D-glutamate ligase [Polyangiaceae bacterium]|nr:UDP-N-acetylmuramoyl-L-alanine--D-glutamate ligase [Polyangiaceae bacterium]